MTNKCTNKLHNHYPNGENNLKWELAWPWWGTFRKTELKYLMNKISANKHKQIKKTHKKWILNNENNCLLELVIKHKMGLTKNIFMQITHRGTKYLCSKTLLHMYLAITTATKKLKLSIRRQIDTNKLFRKRLVIADAFKWKSLILQKITFKRRTFNSRLVDWSFIHCTT